MFREEQKRGDSILLTGKKILVVEDEQLTANIHRNTFVVEGYTVETAYDGPTALQMLEEFRPDLILLDLMLPGMDGVEVIRRVRQHPTFSKVPIVVSSNFYLTTMVENAWKAGANHCLMKSNCTRRELVKIVEKSLQPTPRDVRSTSPGATDQQSHERETQQAFLRSKPELIHRLQSQLQMLFKEENKPLIATQLFLSLHALAGKAALLDFGELAEYSAAFEAFLKELSANPEYINSSTLRTTAQSIDLLTRLLDTARTGPDPARSTAQILVVDDDPISCQAIRTALRRARFQPTILHDPVEATKLIRSTDFDLIFLDVNMPGMSGFELCTEVRQLPNYAKVPVVFITARTDLESRAKSMLSGGNEFIAKPFLVMELTLKALTYMLRRPVPTAVTTPVPA